jgi:hypothetical protein
MEQSDLRKAALALGYVEPISIEPDGTIWLGSQDQRVDLTAAQLDKVRAEAARQTEARLAARVSARTKLAALGLTEAEVAALLGA